ncbi:nuclear exosome regulator NRDE2 [Anomaloglossus baeobatrachus]|uniref:nuclear exosome regulator NRDE2 n=1 Tax=Anomaloglossus baeobatrachus TaxID=238106 RepID=UPI003F508E45
MALFPAFAGCSSAGAAPEQTGLDWLNNRSFCTEDALSLHQRTQLGAPAFLPESPLSSHDPKLLTSVSETSDSEAERKKKKRKKKKKKHKKSKNRKRSSDEDDDEGNGRDLKGPRPVSPTREDSLVSATCRSIWLDEAQSALEETFRIDRKADRANWEYKSLYRGDIARYRRRGRSCLGIDLKMQQIVWEDAKHKKTLQKKAERYYSRTAVRTLRAKAESVRCGADSADPSSNAFIPVKDCAPDPPAPASWVNPLGVYDRSTTMWLQGKGGPESKTPAAEPRDTGLLEKVEDYNRRLREDPGDVSAWMEFVSFQDELTHHPSMYSTSDSEADPHRMSVKMVLEKKLCILERAIESNPASTELKLARLRLCAEFWESAALQKEWQKLIFLHPNDAQLWRKYLHFSQGQFSSFSVSKVNAVYGKCLSTLSAVHDGSMRSHPALPGTERSLCDIFLQQCHFLRQAGHCEKAVSLFQALMDFTFYKPESVESMSTREQVEFFEPFWDSGEPRFGERGAKGWGCWMRQQERGGWVEISDLGEEEEEEKEIDIGDRSRPRPGVWLNMECAREAKHWIPWRPDPAKKQTEDDCEDPERQVFFDDIGPSMIKISSAELKFRLVLSFLQFLGVPCDSRPPPTSLYLFLDDASVLDHTPFYERMMTSSELPLSGISAVGHLDTMSGSRASIGQCKEGERFIQDVFQAAMSCCTEDEKMKLSVYWLQYEIAKVVRCLQIKNKKKLKIQGKRSKRLAKGLLKEPANRSSLALWREYARLEWLLGNTDEARKVFDVAIGLAGSRGLKDPALRGLCLLYAELEAEMAAAPGSRAVHILTSLADGSPYGPFKEPAPAVSILKARKVYERALEDSANAALKGPALEDSEDPALVAVTGCFALFQYLTAGIDSAVAVFRQVSASLAPPAGEGEEAPGSWGPRQALTMMHTNLLKYHMRVSVYPRAPLTEALMSALRLFPHNVALWTSYIQAEGRSLDCRKARRFIDGVRRATHALEPYLYAIRAEEGRKKLAESVQRGESGDVYTVLPETGLSNRIQALYERGLSTEQGARSLLLWRMYLHFTVSQGQMDRGRGLFYKAIQSCPWAKVLYLDAVEYFPDRLQEIIDLMTEKELRVRLPLEELDLLLED